MTTTAETSTGAGTDRRGRRWSAGVLGVAGLLMAAGGQLHPIAEGNDFDGAVASMLGADTWRLSHGLLLLGVATGVAALALAYRHRVFGPSADRWLLAAVVAWCFEVVELVPHLLASRDLEALEHGSSTPVLDLHLWLQVVATPALGLTTAGLAVAIARAARTKPAWVLAAVAVVGGLGYGLAGPVVVLTENVAASALFAAEAAIALWMIGTSVRLWSGTRG